MESNKLAEESKMKGFFDKNKIKSTIDPRNKQSCASCGLYKDCRTPRMKPFGKNKDRIMFIGESPRELDDKRGKPFQDRIGSLLKIALKELNFDLFEQGISLNAVNCETRKPTPNQINCCRVKVLNAIKEYKPTVIVLLGDYAVQSIIGYRWKKSLGSINKWRGWCIPDQDLKVWLCPVYAPWFVNDKEERSGLNLAKEIWKRDLYNAISCLNKSFPDYSNLEKGIIYIKNNKELKECIPKLIKAPLLSFDYESTGVKPHRPEQELVSVSAAISQKECYTWINDPVKAKLWKKVLKSKVPKTAHNLQFEETWSREKIGTEVNNWKICTMNAAHCLDNRKGISSLKFQTYVNFGIPDYDSHISPWITGTKDEYGANSLNKIKEFIKQYGTKDILKYNGLDSIFGLMLAQKQLRLIYGQEETF
jgi:uracil-DNA glycosylase family 4